MFSANRLNFNRLGLIAALACFLAVGCAQSAEQALNRAMSEAGKSKENVYPLAGKVTVDGQAPKFPGPAYRLVVVLNDPDKLDTPTIKKPHVEADQDGSFAFSTYKANDGIKPGKYVVTFGIFWNRSKLGLVPPDELHNLYNDPDANAKIPEFVIDHKAPGKTDYDFNLHVAGKEPVTEPGPHALNGVMDEQDPGANKYRRNK